MTQIQRLPEDALSPLPAAIDATHVFDAFQQREKTLSALQQTLRLVADIQQHRGCSMAILAGNHDFEARLDLLQARVRHRLTYLDQGRDAQGFLKEDYWRAILQEWHAVSEGWRDDTVLHNFELHSHLTEKLLQLFRAGGNWLFETDQAFQMAAIRCLDISVLAFAFQTLPKNIEMLARLRGLSTHAAALGYCDNEHRVRLDYLLQLARREQVSLRTFTAQRPVKVLRMIPGLLDTQLNDVVFTQWTQRIASDVLQTGKIPLSLADELFAQGTEIIDGFFAINQQSLAYIRRALEDMLEEILSEIAR